MNNPQANANNLIWIDMEMTGLSVDSDRIIEIATVITDSELNVIAESPSYVINQPDSILNAMDTWNTNVHSKSGLINRVKQSSYSIENVETELLTFVKQYSLKGTSPLCGNTVHQDRKFMAKYMPALEAYLHYRNLDVSTLKELAKRWYPAIYSGFKKHNKHEALADIHESITELKYYREQMLGKPLSCTTN